jgi:hypothetical protein
MRPGLMPYTLRTEEGAGNAGCVAAPAVSRAKLKKHTSKVTTGSAVTVRRFLRNGFNGLLRALSGDRAFCLRRLRIGIHKLDTSVGASRPRDFAVRTSHHSSDDTSRVHRIPRSTSVTTRTPLLPRRDAGEEPVIWLEMKAKYFCNQDWTTQISLRLLEEFVLWRTRFRPLSRLSFTTPSEKRSSCPVGQNHRQRDGHSIVTSTRAICGLRRSTADISHKCLFLRSGVSRYAPRSRPGGWHEAARIHCNRRQRGSLAAHGQGAAIGKVADHRLSRGRPFGFWSMDSTVCGAPG